MIYFFEHTYFVLEEGIEMTQGTTNEAKKQQKTKESAKETQTASKRSSKN